MAMAVDERDWLWVWMQLHEEGAKLLIPETVFYHHGKPVSWLSSDANEKVCKRPPKALDDRRVMRAMLESSMASMEAHRRATAPSDVEPQAPPFVALARHYVRGGSVRGFLLTEEGLHDLLKSRNGIGSLASLQAYVHPANPPGSRIRCQLESGIDGNMRAAVFQLAYPGVQDPQSVPGARRRVSLLEATDVPPSTARAGSVPSRTVEHAAVRLAENLARHLQVTEHVQVAGLVVDFTLDNRGKLWMQTSPQCLVKNRNVRLQTDLGLAPSERTFAHVAVRSRVEDMMNHILQRSRSATLHGLPWCAGDHCTDSDEGAPAADHWAPAADGEGEQFSAEKSVVVVVVKDPLSGEETRADGRRIPFHSILLGMRASPPNQGAAVRPTPHLLAPARRRPPGAGGG